MIYLSLFSKGLTATLDTSVIRTEEMLWHMLLPRLLCFAEKAWREGDHENILKVTAIYILLTLALFWLCISFAFLSILKIG